MKYYLGFSVVFACGIVAYGDTSPRAHAAGAVEHADVAKTSEKFTGKFGDDESEVDVPQDRLYRSPREESAVVARGPIPALILPNNVCVINTEISPDRTIEEHIVACIKAYKIRQSLTR